MSRCFLAGDDQKAELGKLKGEYEALQSAAIQNDCDFASTLKAARHDA